MKKSIQQIHICAVRKFLAELEEGQYIDTAHTAVICCTEKAMREPALSRLPNCRLQFFDTEEPRDPAAFTREDAEAIRRFLERLPDTITTLYCCCDWGQSRSAGLAAACMTAIGQDGEAVFRNPAYTPNLLVYAYMCQALGCGMPSAERLRTLRALRSAAAKPGAQAAHVVRRILLAGDAAFFGTEPAVHRTWPAALAESLCCPVEDRSTNGRLIPYTRDEMLADRQELGTVLQESLLLVTCASAELRAGLAPAEIRRKLRKYLFWLLYIYQGCTVLPVTLPGFLADGGAERERLEALNAAIREIAEEKDLSLLDASGWERQPDFGAADEYIASRMAAFIRCAFSVIPEETPEQVYKSACSPPPARQPEPLLSEGRKQMFPGKPADSLPGVVKRQPAPFRS